MKIKLLTVLFLASVCLPINAEMIKLYKNSDGKLLYWETWSNESSITLHEGVVGDTGKSFERKLKKDETISALIETLARQKNKEGFSSIPIEEHFTIIISYKIDGWGSKEDLKKRHAIQGIMDESLGWSGNGHCDGGDIGSGEMAIYNYVVDPKQGKIAIEKALKKNGYFEGATISVYAPE